MSKVIKITVSTHQGVLYETDCDYIVAHGPLGEFAILANHVPLISIIEEGYVKIVKEGQTSFVALISGILEFNNNKVTLLAQEAQLGSELSLAKENLLQFRSDRLEKNRQLDVDYTKKDLDLREQLKKAQAGSIKR